jgi:ABC-type branched-subunit amino acid transport system ATPase component
MLGVTQLSKSFGGFKVVDGCSLHVDAGEIVGLIGPNGAGKTTVFNMVTGTMRVDRGEIRLSGHNVIGWPTSRIAQHGLVRTFQTPRLFNDLSVMENFLAAIPQQTGERLLGVCLHPSRVRREEERHEWNAWELLDFLGLTRVANDPASSLSGGQKKLLEFGRALMTQPRIMLLDEPVAGVNPSLANEIAAHILHLRRQGFTFLIIEHNMEFIMRLADRLYVMARGTVLREGRPDAVRMDPAVLEAYLGMS